MNFHTVCIWIPYSFISLYFNSKFIELFNVIKFKDYENNFLAFLRIWIISAILWKLLWFYKIEKWISLHVGTMCLFDGWLSIKIYKLQKTNNRERWTTRLLAEVFDLIQLICTIFLTNVHFQLWKELKLSLDVAKVKIEITRSVFNIW